ncbi:MAG TPA: uracil-DNA glycosylase family protein [Bacteriovoracaceae bacterium]|nr:uracil-DNA glycosylase family protein [Bacteriovoracaceae bacterium]
MEEIFKQNLLNLRQPPKALSFSDALFPGSLWKPQTNRSLRGETPKKILISDEYSEKKQIIESFERFAQEKIEVSPTNIVKIDGGEIGIRPTTAWDDIASFGDMSKLLHELSLPKPYLKYLLQDKKPGRVEVIFVTETFRPWEEASKDFKEGFINELLAGFPLKTAELFERMIMAMKLTAEEVVLYPVDFEDKDISSEVMSIAGFLKPQVIVTLGAKATNKILKTNDRLTLIHGQFHPRTLPDSTTFQVVPLFHPSIIETNQNMKKTAWTDMQKIMKLLKKLP